MGYDLRRPSVAVRRPSTKPNIRLMLLLFGALSFASTPATADSFPGVGNGDALCSPQAGGPTICLVNEGQGDRLIEEVINGSNVNITINSITAGPIKFLAGDKTDTITSDPITHDVCSGVILAPGAFCFFTQSFTTATPGDPDDGTKIPQDGTAAMFFNLTFSPQFPILGPPPGNNSQHIVIAGPGTTMNPDGSITAQIESAVVSVSDTPEPSALVLFGTGLVSIMVVIRRKLFL